MLVTAILVLGLTGAAFCHHCLSIARRGAYPAVNRVSAYGRVGLLLWSWWLAAAGLLIAAVPDLSTATRLLIGATLIATAMAQTLRFVKLQAIAMIDAGAEHAKTKVLKR